MIKKLVITIVSIFIIIGVYSCFPKKSNTKENDLFVFKSYFHFFLNTNPELRNINDYPISTKKQIDYILTVNQVESNFLTAFNYYTMVSDTDDLNSTMKKNNDLRLLHIWDEIHDHMLKYHYNHVKISQLAELKQGLHNDSRHWAPAEYPRVSAESCYLKN